MCRHTRAKGCVEGRVCCAVVWCGVVWCGCVERGPTSMRWKETDCWYVQFSFCLMLSSLLGCSLSFQCGKLVRFGAVLLHFCSHPSLPHLPSPASCHSIGGNVLSELLLLVLVLLASPRLWRCGGVEVGRQLCKCFCSNLNG